MRESVSEALRLSPHKNDLVFGDLQEGNLLYLPRNGGRALFIDFDGFSQDGKDRYSTCLDPAVELGVDRLQIMEKSHDLDNLERLMDQPSARTRY